MARKRDRIDALTVKLTLHIPINSGSRASAENAADNAQALLHTALGFGQATMTTAYGRIVAPVAPVAAEELALVEHEDAAES